MSKMMGLMVLAAVLSLSNAQAVVEVAAPAKLPFQNVTTGYTVRVRSPSTDCRLSLRSKLEHNGPARVRSWAVCERAAVCEAHWLTLFYSFSRRTKSSA